MENLDIELTPQEQLQELIADSAVAIMFYNENNLGDGVLGSHVEDVWATIKNTKPELFQELQSFTTADIKQAIRTELEQDCKDFADAYNLYKSSMQNFVNEYIQRHNIKISANAQFSARANGSKVVIDLISGTDKHSAVYKCRYENPSKEWETLSWGKFEYIVLPTIKDFGWYNDGKKPLEGTLITTLSNNDLAVLIDVDEDGIMINAEFCKHKNIVEIASEALEGDVTVYKIIRNEATIDVLFKLQDEFKVEFPAIADIYFAYTHYQDEKFEPKFKVVFFSLVKSRSEADEMLSNFDFFNAVDNHEYTQQFEKDYASAIAQQSEIRTQNLVKRHNGLRLMYGEEHYEYYMLYKYPLSEIVKYIQDGLGTNNAYDLIENFMKLANIQGSSEYFDGEKYAPIKSVSERDRELMRSWFAKDNWIHSETLLKDLDINERTFKKYAYGTTSGKYEYKPEYVENLHWITSNNVRLYNKLAVEWHSIARGADKPFWGFAIDKNLIKNIK